jgi:predicted DNA-binding transcriptional regulator
MAGEWDPRSRFPPRRYRAEPLQQSTGEIPRLVSATAPAAPTLASGVPIPSGNGYRRAFNTAVSVLAPAPLAPPGPGYLGITEQTEGTDWQLQLALGEAVVRVAVAPASPAAREGLRTGDYLQSINGVSLAEFQAARPLAGSEAIIKAHRPGRGEMLFAITLIARREPAKPRAPRMEWPAMTCGEAVARNERLKYLALVTGNPRLLLVDKAVASRLVTYHLRQNGNASRAFSTLAADLGINERTVRRAVARLHREGLLAFRSGRKAGVPNVFTPCWPAEAAPNVVTLTLKGAKPR